MTFTESTTRWAVAVGIAVVAAVTLLATALTAQSSEQGEARGIDAACSRAAQDTSVTTEERRQGFADIDGNVHEAAINCLAHWSVAQGRDGAYLPGEAVRRDQMASFIARTERPSDFSFPESQGDTFSDIAGNTHAENINTLAAAGIVQGRDDGTYAPREPVSRAAMASFVARTLETVTGEELSGNADSPFPDTTGSVHEGNIDALASLGVVQGRDDGTYAPHETVRRDQMASFLARSMDYLAAQGHWPVPSTVELSPAEDTNPANLIHRLRGTVYNQWGQDDPGDTYYAADVRVEVYRDADGGHALVHTDRVVSGLGGSLSFAYNAEASAGDADVIAACPLTAGDDPGADAHWCADVTTTNGDSSVVADDDRGAATVAKSWADPVEADAAAAGHYPGDVLAHDLERATLELQTARRPGGDGEQLVRLGYNAADRFTVASPEVDLHDATLAQFECAVQAGLDHDDEAYPHLTVQYDPEAESLFDLSTPADVAHCDSSDEPTGEFSREERASEDFPGPGRTQLVDVRTAAHEAFDRVAFELAGDPVSWQVTWEEEPIRLDPSGKLVDVDGEAFLKVHMTASARDVDGEMTYEGPTRLPVEGAVATEAVMTSDHHGGMIWVVGLEREAPFRVDVLSNPQRLFVDVAS